jgi:hypothetical protein
LTKIDPLKIFEDHDTMQKNLMAMKWDKDAPIEDLKRSLSTLTERTSNPLSKGRDNLRRTILEEAADTISVKDLLGNLNKKGYSQFDVENCIEELIRNGLLFSPRFGFIKRLD